MARTADRTTANPSPMNRIPGTRNLPNIDRGRVVLAGRNGLDTGRVALTDDHVLIQGESGTGKELAAASRFEMRVSG